MKYPQNYKCTTRAGVLKRIEGCEMLIAAYKNCGTDKWAIARLKRDIANYKRQLESLPLKRKKITL